MGEPFIRRSPCTDENPTLEVVIYEKEETLYMEKIYKEIVCKRCKYTGNSYIQKGATHKMFRAGFNVMNSVMSRVLQF